MLRYERAGRERWMGLGSAATFSLKEARDRARAARQLLADGIDPLEQKKADKAARALAEAKGITFREAAEAFFGQNEKKWRNAKASASSGPLPTHTSRCSKSWRSLTGPVCQTCPNPGFWTWLKVAILAASSR